MKYPNVNEVRERLRQLMQSHKDATVKSFTSLGIVNEALVGGMLGELGLTPEDMARYMLLGEVEKLRAELSRPASDGQATLPGLDSIHEDQLWNLGKGESIWAVNAEHRHLMAHLALVEENRSRVNAQADKIRRDIYVTGLAEYLLSHPGATVRDFSEMVAAQEPAV